MRKELALNLALSITSALALTGLTPKIASADHYYSPAPVAPAVPTPTDSWYITTSDRGVKFYGVTPFYSQETTDQNLFVSGVVMMMEGESVHGSYVMIDCGRLSYRDLMPWFVIDSTGSEYSKEPPTYDWQYFKSSSVFEIVGRRYCEEAARQRGIEWVWYR